MSLFRLLDINGMFHPLWRYHEAKGSPPGTAADECVNVLRRAASAKDADYVVACCDSPNCFRVEIAKEYRALVPDYPGYKGDRAAREPALYAALDRVISEIEQDGIPVMRAPGAEADDVIATITTWATAQGHDVAIHSEDKDLLSLVVDPDPENESAPSVVVVRRDGTRQNGDACAARLGVPPSLVEPFLALVGDKSDGVLGIPDVGKTWAVRLLWGEHDAQKQWRPTPFKNFDAIVAAAVNEQAEVERVASEALCKRVHNGVKKNFPDAEIAARLKITVEDVARYKAMPEPPKIPEHKAYFDANVRKNLISHAASFGIGLRLTRLWREVPLDFSRVTAARTPPRDLAKEAERQALLEKAQQQAEEEDQAAQEALQALAEEQNSKIMSTQATITDAEFTENKPATEATKFVDAATPQQVQAAQPAQNGNGAKPVAAQSTALARLPERPFDQQLEPRNLTEAQWLAKSIAASRKIKDAGDENAVLLKLTVGRSLNMSLYQCLRMYLMEGQVVMRTQQVLARVKSSPLCEYIRVTHLDSESCTWVTKRRGEPEQSRTFTIAMARRAMLGGIKEPGGQFNPESAWAKWTEDMLSARAVMPLMRQEYPELADGYSKEELGMDDRVTYDTVGEAA